MPSIDHVPSSPTLPKRASAVVIGAGIAGISTALELQARGLDVVVVEKGEVAAEQSSRNWGWCRQMGRDPREIALIKISLELWRGMNGKIGAETGFRQCGIVYLSETNEAQAERLDWVEKHARPAGLSTRILNSAEAEALVPDSTAHFKGAIFTPDDGRAEPFIAAPAMAKFFQSKGGVIVTNCAARGVELAGGHVSSVVTEKGAIATNTAILAGGYWSSRFLHNLGVRFPQLGVVTPVLRTTSLDIGHEHTFAAPKYAVRKRLDGGFTVAHGSLTLADFTPNHIRYALDFLPMLKLEHRSLRFHLGRRFFEELQLKRRWALDEVTPFEKVRVLDPSPSNAILDDAYAGLQKAFPLFRNAQVAERWAGVIDGTPDAVPVIDAIDGVPGLYMLSGLSGHGFGLGPGAGKLMAEIALGERPCVDPTPFRFVRFSDGTRHKPTTGF
jgi:glycine/D-amino acid oxidase-like deaminating enzyme